ncbi:MAG: hypothetical protein ACKO8I_06900, partial [Cyanobacteriota bacterium]
MTPREWLSVSHIGKTTHPIIVEHVVIAANRIAGRPKHKVIQVNPFTELAVRQNRMLQQGSKTNRIINLLVHMAKLLIRIMELPKNFALTLKHTVEASANRAFSSVPRTSNRSVDDAPSEAIAWDSRTRLRSGRITRCDTVL